MTKQQETNLSMKEYDIPEGQTTNPKYQIRNPKGQTKNDKQ